MNRNPNIIPEPIVKEMQNYSDNDFIRYVCNNHMQLFDDQILQTNNKEIKTYINDLFIKYRNPKTFNNQKNEESNFVDLKNAFAIVEKEDDYLNAIKEVLWQLGNIPSTSKKILTHIVKVDNNGIFQHVNELDYPAINNVLNNAIFTSELVLEKVKLDKNVYLYKNTTNKRKGFYYKGNLLSLKELSEINNVPVVTIKKRLAKGMNLIRAIQ